MPMAQIVIVTSGIPSLCNSAFALARQLSAAGHEVKYASAAPIKALVSAQGLPFIHLDAEVPHSQPPNSPRTRIEKVVSWFRKFVTIRERQHKALAALGVHDFEDKIRALAPDLCIIDVELSAYIISACALNIPTATLAAFISLRKYPNVPPLHIGVVPGQGWRGSRFGIAWAWLAFRLWKWKHFQIQRLRAVGADALSVLRLHARNVGFPFEREVEQYQWLLPFIFRHLPLLYTNALEIDFPHHPHQACRHLGPLVSPGRNDIYFTGAQHKADKALDALLAGRRQNPHRKLIYCAFGAFYRGDDSAFFRKVIEAVRNDTDWDVIIALGGRKDPRELPELPPHIHAFTWVPQLRALEYADCAVIHGGNGSVKECIHFGVPMLVYPFKNTNDQSGTAARIAYHRLGVVGDRDSDDAAQIRRHIETLLTDEACRSRVAAMSARLQYYEDEQRAALIINDLLHDAKNGAFPLIQQ